MDASPDMIPGQLSALPAGTDLLLTALVGLGLAQMAWFSVMLLRRGMPPASLQHALPPLLALWVVLWPVYHDARWLWAGIAILFALSLLARFMERPFWAHLRHAWTDVPADPTLETPRHLPPMLHVMLALAVAAAWFQNIPEFGFGLALSLCLGMPAAYWLDRAGYLRLGFPAHPEQTLAGHIAFILISALVLCWSLHVYHGTPWQPLLIATLIAAMAGSATRALVPGQWHLPASMLSMGLVMWLL